MVRYSKKFGDLSDNPITWSIGGVIEFLYKYSEHYIYKTRNRQEFYEEVHKHTEDVITGRQLTNLFYDLKRKNYIEVIESDKEHAIKLTNKAKIKIIDQIVESKEQSRYRFVSFDIPERLHSNRDKFRRAIKRMGFRQVQQSLWVINKNVGELVEMLAKEYKVEDYVAYIVSEKSNIDSHVRDRLIK